MREKTIEQKFRAAVKAAGGLAVKFTSPGFDGVPDRLALLPDGKMAFVDSFFVLESWRVKRIFLG